MSSARDIRASRSRKRGNAKVQKTSAIFGLRLRGLLAYYDPATSCWKTYQATFPWASAKFSETWPDSGMTQNGSVYELRTSGRAISERECSLWPTAVAKDDGKTPEAHLAMTQRMGERDGTFANRTAITSLAVKVQTWRTARAEDGESCGNHPSKADSLTGVTRHWPTPNVPNGGRTSNVTNRREDGSKRQIDLGALANCWLTPHGMSNRDHKGKVGGCGGDEFALQANRWSASASTPAEAAAEPSMPMKTTPECCPLFAADGAEIEAQAALPMTGSTEEPESQPSPTDPERRMWQTPATDSFRSRGGERKDEMGLDQQARFFPTPAARDAKGTNLVSRTQRHGKKDDQLPNFVEHHFYSRPDPPIPAGKTSLPDGPTLRRRLNPRFVEWLMGFPIAWTEVDWSTGLAKSNEH